MKPLPKEPFCFSLAAQWALGFAVATLLFALPPLLRQTTNIVTETYRLGTLRFFHHTNPYELPLIGGDRFEYSPFFCLLYAPFAWLPKTLQAICWAFANAFLFWWGLFSWTLPKKKNPAWLWVALVLASMELNISLLYQQVNAALIGATLLGVALYRERKYLGAGILLTFATNVKMYPGIFALALLWPLQSQYVKGLLLGSVLALLLPAAWIGLTNDWYWHRFWIERLSEAATYVRDDLNVSSIFNRYQARPLGQMLEGVILFFSAWALLWRSAFPKNETWKLWLALGSCGLLLVNPRTESPTFIFVAPASVFLAEWIFSNPRKSPQFWLLVLVWGLTGFIMTLAFTDLWPKRVWNPGTFRYATKTLGTLMLWVLALGYWIRARRLAL